MNRNIDAQNDILSAVDFATSVSLTKNSPNLTIQEIDLNHRDKEKKVFTLCRGCICDCGVIATVRNGRVVKLEGNPDHPYSKGRLCAKGLSGIQALYNPMRNKYPLIRVGKRGENKWRRISWDQALDMLADILWDLYNNAGPEYLLGSTGGGGNPLFVSVPKFVSAFGSPNWFEPGCAQCLLPRMMAAALTTGGPMPSISDSGSPGIYLEDKCELKTLVLWASAPAYSCPGEGGGEIVRLRKQGVKTIAIDPRFTADAAQSEVWLPIRPGTDVGLMLTWIRYIIDTGRYDHEFVMKWTNLPYLVNTETKFMWRAEKSEAMGQPDTYMVWDKKTNSAQPLVYPWNDDYDVELDGEYEIDGVVYKTAFRLLRERVEPWTVAKAAEVCRLREDKIVEAIELFLNNQPSAINLGVATDQMQCSQQAADAVLIIDLLLGNIENPGALMQRFPGSGIDTGCPFNFDETYFLSAEQFAKRIGGNEYKGVRMWNAAPIGTILDALETGMPYRPKVWIERSGNKLHNMADAGRVEKCIEKVEFICHLYMYPTSFSMYADMLLPITEWLESDCFKELLNVICIRQEVVHLYETINEGEVLSLLAKRLAEKGHPGFKDAWNAELMGINGPYWNTLPELMDRQMRRIGSTWEEAKEKGYVEFMPLEQYVDYYVYKHEGPDGKPVGFGTPSRKAELYLEGLIVLGRTGLPFSGGVPMVSASKDYDPLPYYEEPYENPLPECEVSEEYPLVMTNGRVPFYHHGTLRNIPYLREIYPVPELWVHPVDAEKYGVKADEWAWIASPRGKIRGKVKITKGIGQGTVYMERFWFPENLTKDTHGFKEANVNMLSRSRGPFNDISGSYQLRAYQVKIWHAEEGAPEGIWTKPEQFKAWLPEYSDPTPAPPRRNAVIPGMEEV